MSLRSSARSLTIILCILRFGFPQNARCEGDAVPSVAILAGFSDVIVVGTATPEDVTTTSATVDIQVERVLKGKAVPNMQMQVPFASRSAQCTVPPSAVAVTAIWFLTRQASGAMAFANSPKSQSCHPFLTDYEVPEGALPAQWSYPEDAKPEDKLAYELAWSIESHQGDGPVALVMNANLLDGASKTVALQIYRELYSSSTPDIRITGMLGLLRLGDADTLRALADNVNQAAQQPRRGTYLRYGQRLPISYGSSGLTPTQGMETQETVIAETVARVSNSSDDAVKQLGRLSQASTSSQPIRHAAARALAEIHTPLALTYLAPFLYDNNDATFRAYAIGGIACFANGVPVLDPTRPDGRLNLNYSSIFKTEETLSHFAMGLPTISKRESYYLDFWRSWWSSNGAAVQAKVSASP